MDLDISVINVHAVQDNGYQVPSKVGFGPVPILKLDEGQNGHFYLEVLYAFSRCSSRASNTCWCM